MAAPLSPYLGAAGRPVSGPYEKRNGFRERRRGGPMWPPAGRSGTGPYKKNGNVPGIRRRGRVQDPPAIPLSRT